MKGQKALLLSFKKYFKKYSFLLFLLILVVCFSSIVLSILDNMYLSYEYREKAMVKGDALLYVPFSSSDVVIKALEDASEKMDNCVTDIRVKYPSLTIYIEGDNNERVYLDAVLSSSLSGDEILVLGEYIPKGDITVFDGETNNEVDCLVVVDDARALNLFINSHEVLCSQDVYKSIAAYQGISVNGYYGEIEFDIKDGTDLERLLNVLLEECGLKSEGTKKGYRETVYIVGSKDSSRAALSDWYLYDFKTKEYRREYIVLFNEKYNDIELMNEVDRFNTPVHFLNEFAKSTIPLICVAFIFISISIYEVRRKEFKLYRDLGMSRIKISLLLLAESCVLIIFVALVSALVILICSVAINFFTPTGAQIVKGKHVYFRDLYTLNGKYSLNGVWKSFFTSMTYVSIFFVFILYILNSVLLFLDEKKEKKR